MRALQVRWKLRIATTACKFCSRVDFDSLSLADKNIDFAGMMKRMIQVKILKNTWLALFAEIIVSVTKNCFDTVEIPNKLYVDLPVLPKTWG